MSEATTHHVFDNSAMNRMSSKADRDSDMQALSPNRDDLITVLIPVYNAPDQLRNLLYSIVNNTCFKIVKEVIIGDDCSDAQTVSLIESFSKDNPFIRVIRNDTNLGFLGNSNNMFSQADSSIVVLVNSDVEVPETWAERVLRAFQANPSLGLACPTTSNATNLSILPPNGQNWRDIDCILRGISPRYPECRPAVGFFLCIRKSAISGELFDSRFGHGYWEDTDLYMRIVDKGFDVKVIDNLHVYHSHRSPSFSSDYNLEDINVRNRQLFLERWGEDSLSVNHVELSRLPLRHLVDNGNMFRFFQKKELRVLFVLPAVIPNVGGISVVMKIVDELNRAGVPAGVYSYGPVDSSYVRTNYQTMPFANEREIYNSLSSLAVIFSTSYDSVKVAVAIQQIFGSQLWYLVQGPEAAFNCGRFAGRVESEFLLADKIICVSPMLSRYLDDLSLANHEITFGPSNLEFYASNRPRKTGTIAACLRGDPMKGSGALVTNLLAAKQAGFELHLFGQSEGWDILNSEVFWYGPLRPDRLRKLFSDVEYFLDMSHMEGLGLLPLEAKLCGCIPILYRENGLEGILEQDHDYVKLPHEFGNTHFFDELLHRGMPSDELSGNIPGNKDYVFEVGFKKLMEILPRPNNLYLTEHLSQVTEAGGHVVGLSKDIDIGIDHSIPNKIVQLSEKIEGLGRLLTESENKVQSYRVAATESESRKREALAEAEAITQSLLVSTSWKITGPLRWLRRKFHS